MDSIAKIMNALESEQWFTIKSIKSKCKLPRNDIKIVLNFLKKYEFLQLNDKQELRLNPDILDLAKPGR
jgi:hypothetical protein